MKKISLALSAALLISMPTFGKGKDGGYSRTHSGPTADHTVRGHRNDGKPVVPHHATNRNDTKADNYSTKGNVNPYTGKPGTKSAY